MVYRKPKKLSKKQKMLEELRKKLTPRQKSLRKLKRRKPPKSIEV